VSSTPRPAPLLPRTSSGIPSSASSLLICCETAAGVKESASAAAAKVPTRTTVANVWSRLKFIAPATIVTCGKK
jgi:hypothetical protein